MAKVKIVSIFPYLQAMDYHNYTFINIIRLSFSLLIGTLKKCNKYHSCFLLFPSTNTLAQYLFYF